MSYITVTIETTSEKDQFILRRIEYGDPQGFPVVANGRYQIANAVEKLLEEAFPEPPATRVSHIAHSDATDEQSPVLKTDDDNDADERF